jgi:hypothetical protein
MEFLFGPITSEKLEDKGQNLYKLGKLFMFAGICGFGVLLLISLIVLVTYSSDALFEYVLLLDTDSGALFIDFLVNTLVFFSYLGIILGFAGIPMYFSGLNIFALGRIAHNTEKNN